MVNVLLQRLKERKLVQWALAYLAGAWVVLQVLDLLGQNFAWPSTIVRSRRHALDAGVSRPQRACTDTRGRSLPTLTPFPSIHPSEAS